MEPWSIDYADGAANRYRLRSDADGARFEYVPVTPEQSSTGRYSGGPPHAGVLTADAITAIRAHVGVMELATGLHLSDRIKGSGSFTVTDSAGTRSFLLGRCDSLAAWDAMLAALRYAHGS